MNKMHHLIHYPDMMRLLGPPIRYWCMRFESFHCVIKRRAQFIGKFTNICKSLACHVQRLHGLNLLENQIVSPEIIIGPIKTIDSNVNVQLWLEALNFEIFYNSFITTAFIIYEKI